MTRITIVLTTALTSLSVGSSAIVDPHKALI